MKIIDEVKEITANEVAKKQDAAKLNFPNIIAKIKAQAGLGFSSCTLIISEMNEYDKQLLQQEGFRVSLDETPRNRMDDLAGYVKNREPLKVWRINW